MLTLTSGDDRALIDELHGAAVIDAWLGGVRPLAAPCVDAPAPVDVAASEDAWVAGWQGGWQPNFPNAGQPAAGRHPQGFHGNASQSAWQVIECRQDVVRLEWSDYSFLAVREIRLAAGQISVAMRVCNTGEQPREFVCAEHLVLGRDLLRVPGVLNPGSDAGAGPGSAVDAELHLLTIDGEPREIVAWPGPEQDRWMVVDSRTPARVAALAVPDRCVRFSAGQFGATVTWQGLPYALVWEELEATTGAPFWGRARALGIEPTSTPHGGGLDVAARRGDAVTLGAGADTSWTVCLTVTSASGAAANAESKVNMIV